MTKSCKLRLNVILIFAITTVFILCLTCAAMADDSSTSSEQVSSTETETELVGQASTDDAEKNDVSSESKAAVVETGSTTSTVRGPLQDGTYIISSSKDGFKVVDQDGNGNVQVGEASGADSQRYSFKYYGTTGTDGYYTVAGSNGKYLSVADEDKNSGANAVMKDFQDGALWQRWLLVPYGNGIFGIKSAFNGLMLDLKNGRTSAGNNIWLYTRNDTAAQKYCFYKAADNVEIKDGVYTIASGLDKNKVVDQSSAGMFDKTNVQLYQSNGTNAQKWIIQKVSGNVFRIYSANSGKLMDVANGSKNSGANIWNYSNNNTDAQKWIIRNFGDGSVYFTSLLSGKVMDVASARTANGTNIWAYDSNGTTAQRFYLLSTTYHPVEDGAYVISNKGNRNMVIDVNGANRRVAVNVQLYTSNGTAAQKFKFKQNSDGFYTITNVNSRHVLDVASALISNGANIWQYSSNDSNAQKWIIHVNSDGSVTLISACSSKVIDIANGKLKNGSNIQQYAFNNTNAQKFVLVSTTYDPALDEQEIDYRVYTPLSKGIDVSEFQGKINWASVKNAGITFAFIRAGGRYTSAGTIFNDSYFDANMKGAIFNDIPVGAYFFTAAINESEAIEEAQHLINRVKNYNVSLPLVIDTEGTGRHANISVQARTNVVKAFCQTISKAGYTPMIYASTNWLTNKLIMSQLSGIKVWVAQYYDHVTYNGSYQCWQYSSKGRVSGINGNVDLDQWYG